MSRETLQENAAVLHNLENNVRNKQTKYVRKECKEKKTLAAKSLVNIYVPAQYGIQPIYHTVCLSFSILLEKLVKYPPIKDTF